MDAVEHEVASQPEGLVAEVDEELQVAEVVAEEVAAVEDVVEDAVEDAEDVVDAVEDAVEEDAEEELEPNRFMLNHTDTLEYSLPRRERKI